MVTARLLTAREAAEILRCHEKTIPEVIALARAVEADWERRWVEWARELALLDGDEEGGE